MSSHAIGFAVPAVRGTIDRVYRAVEVITNALCGQRKSDAAGVNTMSQAILGWSYVIVGTVLVGIGGSVATLGWNKIRAYDQWRGTVLGLAREVDLNDRMIAEAAQLAKRWRPSATENFSYEPYLSTHIIAVVTSGVLKAEVPEDRALLEALEGYEQAISRFNAALLRVGRHNPGLFIKQDLIHTTDPKAWPTDGQDALAEPFLALLRAHEAAKNLLNRRYGWATKKGSR